MFIPKRLPIHCAVIGGSLKILSWLIDVHHCPIKIINTGSRNMAQELIETSEGRTLLDLAIAHKRVSILHYLVNQKRISIPSGKEKNEASLMALEAVLKAFPQSPASRSRMDVPPSPSLTVKRLGNKNVQEGSNYLFNITSPYDDEDSDSDQRDDYEERNPAHTTQSSYDDEESVVTTMQDPVRKNIFDFFSPFQSI
jgi:hypothetical protein